VYVCVRVVQSLEDTWVVHASPSRRPVSSVSRLASSVILASVAVDRITSTATEHAVRQLFQFNPLTPTVAILVQLIIKYLD